VGHIEYPEISVVSNQPTLYKKPQNRKDFNLDMLYLGIFLKTEDCEGLSYIPVNMVAGSSLVIEHI
jgi:hypothetical protein